LNTCLTSQAYIRWYTTSCSWQKWRQHSVVGSWLSTDTKISLSTALKATTGIWCRS
jgi:hypothetical protein